MPKADVREEMVATVKRLLALTQCGGDRQITTKSALEEAFKAGGLCTVRQLRGWMNKEAKQTRDM